MQVLHLCQPVSKKSLGRFWTGKAWQVFGPTELSQPLQLVRGLTLASGWRPQRAHEGLEEILETGRTWTEAEVKTSTESGLMQSPWGLTVTQDFFLWKKNKKPNMILFIKAWTFKGRFCNIYEQCWRRDLNCRNSELKCLVRGHDLQMLVLVHVVVG